MIDTRTAPLAASLLRVALGGVFIARAGLKLFDPAPPGQCNISAASVFPPL